MPTRIRGRKWGGGEQKRTIKKKGKSKKKKPKPKNAIDGCRGVLHRKIRSRGRSPWGGRISDKRKNGRKKKEEKRSRAGTQDERARKEAKSKEKWNYPTLKLRHFGLTYGKEKGTWGVHRENEAGRRGKKTKQSKR